MMKSDKIIVDEIEAICTIAINYLENIKEKTVENQNILILLYCLYEKIENLYININQ